LNALFNRKKEGREESERERERGRESPITASLQINVDSLEKIHLYVTKRKHGQA